jgi:hypothetical protein
LLVSEPYCSLSGLAENFQPELHMGGSTAQSAGRSFRMPLQRPESGPGHTENEREDEGSAKSDTALHGKIGERIFSVILSDSQ